MKGSLWRMKNILLAVAGVGLVLAAACGTSESTTPPPGTFPSVVTRSPAPTPGTLSLAPTPASAARPIGQVLIPVEDGAPTGEQRAHLITEFGQYLLEVATNRLWKVLEGDNGSFSVSPDGTAALPVGDPYLDVVDLSDGSAVRIFDGGASSPIWSPDSKQIAFLSDGLYVVNKDGSGLRKVYSQALGQVWWSPLGGQIAFGVWNADGSGRTTLYILNLSSGSATEIAAQIPAFSPIGSLWSPDGSLLAFEDKDGLVIYDTSTGEQRLLVSGPVGYPSWSPDGSRIMYGVTAGTDDGLTNAYYVVDVNAPGQPRLVVPAAGEAFWSSDGTRIGYLSPGCSSGEWDIYITDTTGASQKRLTTTPELIELFPAWQPGGSGIVYATGEGVVITDADSGADRIVLLRGHDFGPALASRWSPDGRYLIISMFGKGVCD